jgi:hypothetical protein
MAIINFSGCCDDNLIFHVDTGSYISPDAGKYTCIKTDQYSGCVLVLSGGTASGSTYDYISNYGSYDSCEECQEVCACEPCCYSCKEYEITNPNNETIEVSWTDCNGYLRTYDLPGSGTTHTICACENSVGPESLNIELTGVCTKSCNTGDCTQFSGTTGLSGVTISYEDCFLGPSGYSQITLVLSGNTTFTFCTCADENTDPNDFVIVGTGVTWSNEVTLCPCEPAPTPTPTPTLSVTPSITPSISITPTPTPTITITPSITPSITLTPTPTPSSCINDLVTPKGVKITFNSQSDYTNCTVYTGITSTTATGSTYCIGMGSNDICDLTGITANLMEIYVRIDCEGCCEQTYRINLNECCNSEVSPTPTPSVTSTPIPEPTPSVTSTSTPIPEPTPSVTSTPIPEPTPSVTSTSTPIPSSTPEITPSPDPTSSVTPSPTSVIEPTDLPTPTPTPTPSSTPEITPSPECLCYTYQNNDPEPCIIDYFNCDEEPTQIIVNSGQSGDFCAISIINDPCVIVTPTGQPCINGLCPGEPEPTPGP